jgi:formiminotetrahydrofolate cyclodeaminase
MSLLDLQVRSLIDRFASAAPTPGGGSASALAGATAAALVAMVCSMPKTRTGSAEERQRLDLALAVAREARDRLGGLVDEDAAAYDAVMAAYGLPKGTDDEKKARRAAVSLAMDRATSVPLETAEACLGVLKAAQEAAGAGNPNALSDARTAGALAFAGLLGGAENVRINAPGDEKTLARVAALVHEGRERIVSLGLSLA